MSIFLQLVFSFRIVFNGVRDCLAFKFRIAAIGLWLTCSCMNDCRLHNSLSYVNIIQLTYLRTQVYLVGEFVAKVSNYITTYCNRVFFTILICA